MKGSGADTGGEHHQGDVDWRNDSHADGNWEFFLKDDVYDDKRYRQ